MRQIGERLSADEPQAFASQEVRQSHGTVPTLRVLMLLCPILYTHTRDTDMLLRNVDINATPL